MAAHNNKQPGEESSSLAARRARLRGSLSKAATPDEASTLPPADAQADSLSQGQPDLNEMASPAVAPAPSLVPDPASNLSLAQAARESQFEPAHAQSGFLDQVWQQAPELAPAPAEPAKPIETNLSPDVLSMLTHIDEATNACAGNLAALQAAYQLQKPEAGLSDLLANVDAAMNACALNLAALQKIADEQTQVLKNLSDTLKNQTLYEIGLNLNNLTDSLAAALEPMKAAGELVPAIDQLVTAMDQRASVDAKYAPGQLVMNMADQLSAGTIDPFTFKRAYMAIFPKDHPADLLRRLVELLGTQRLSSDLFRAAYEAVAADEPPPRPAQAPAPSPQLPGDDEMLDDGETRAELVALRHANEEMRQALQERENEFEQLLAAKDMELQEAQETLSMRHEEFDTRYAELTEALNQREEEYQDLLENKDMELTEKNKELSLLRHQMEELRSQTEELGKDLQAQMADIRIAREAASSSPALPGKPATSGSFFDSAPPAKPSSLFDAEPAPAEKPFFAGQPAQPAPAQAPPQPAPAAARVQDAGYAQGLTQQPAARQSSMSAPAGAQFVPGSGSYGSGVRAQVFEVIVRQALAGAPWREICSGPMQVNNITAEEVEAEVARRQSMLNK